MINSSLMPPRAFTGTTLVMVGPGSVALVDFGVEVEVGVGVEVAVDFGVGVAAGVGVGVAIGVGVGLEVGVGDGVGVGVEVGLAVKSRTADGYPRLAPCGFDRTRSAERVPSKSSPVASGTVKVWDVCPGAKFKVPDVAVKSVPAWAVPFWTL